MKKISKESIKKEEKRRKIKEGAYTKFNGLSSYLVNTSHYSGFDSTLATFLALNMAAEATKRNLMKMGATAADIESARGAIKKEMWVLIGLQDRGVTQELIQRRELESEQADKK